MDNDSSLSPSAGSTLQPVIRDQTIVVAKFVKRTINLNGSLDDWTGVVPVILDSETLENRSDPTRELLNPALEQSAGTSGKQQIVARVYTAYDDTNVYLAAVVHEDQFRCSAGQPSLRGQKVKITLPYREGMPDGLRYITSCGNVFQFSFGFRDRVPGIGRQMVDPWAWKGCFYDTDYSFVAHVSSDGDQLIRIWGPDNSRQDGYQTEAFFRTSTVGPRLTEQSSHRGHGGHRGGGSQRGIGGLVAEIDFCAPKPKGRVKCKMRKTKSAVRNGETRDEGVNSYPCGKSSLYCAARFRHAVRPIISAKVGISRISARIVHATQ